MPALPQFPSAIPRPSFAIGFPRFYYTMFSRAGQSSDNKDKRKGVALHFCCGLLLPGRICYAVLSGAVCTVNAQCKSVVCAALCRVQTQFMYGLESGLLYRQGICWRDREYHLCYPYKLCISYKCDLERGDA